MQDCATHGTRSTLQDTKHERLWIHFQCQFGLYPILHFSVQLRGFFNQFFYQDRHILLILFNQRQLDIRTCSYSSVCIGIGYSGCKGYKKSLWGRRSPLVPRPATGLQWDISVTFLHDRRLNDERKQGYIR